MAGYWRVPAQLATDPAIVETTSLATLPLPLDLAALLGPGEVASAPRTALTDLTTGQPVPLPPPTLEAGGLRIVQVVGGLTAGRDYRLVWAWTVRDGHAPSRITIVRCVA